MCCVFVHISKSPQRNNDHLSFSCLCPVCVQSVIYEVKGQQVKLHADITGKPEQLLWKHNNDVIVEFNGIKEKVFGSFEGRIHLNVLTAQLQISDLRFEDTGNYEYEVYASRNFFRKSYELKVIGRKSTSLFSSFLLKILINNLLPRKPNLRSNVKVVQVLLVWWQLFKAVSHVRGLETLLSKLHLLFFSNIN